MKLTNQSIIFSPSDISVFHLSKFASFMDHIWMKKRDLAKSWGAKISQDSYMALLGEQGDKHEHKILDELLKQYGEDNVAKLNMKDSDSLAKTEAAMREGKSIIFQANLSRDNFKGYADFLVRVEEPSNLGDYSYQVWDAKLSQVARTEHILQVCAYSWMLEPILGRLEAEAGFYLGRGKSKTIRVAEYFAYFESVKSEFTTFQDNISLTKEAMPDINSEKTFGRWDAFAQKEIEKQDSLRQVAGIRVTQINKLRKQGINTLTDLAQTQQTQCKGVGSATFDKLKGQAQLQYASKDSEKPKIKYLAEVQGKGFQKLPKHDDADVFFDIEGHPLMDGGLEYLWGATLHKNTLNAECPQGKEYPFLDWWAHDAGQEKILIENFIDWVYDRWQQHPNMRVYHYASYEITALKKLTGKFNTRIEKLDELLRNDVFVDLYRIVTQAMQLGTKNYSIKSVEALYDRKHDGAVANGAESIVEYEKWRIEAGVGDENTITPIGWDHSQILVDIRDYNIDDCESTLELVVWLRQQQEKSGISYVNEIKEPKEKSEQAIKLDEKKSALKERQQAINNTYETSDALKADPIATRLMDLVEFHAREDKPKWWEYYNLKDSNDEELFDNVLAIVNANVIDKELVGENPTITISFDNEQPYRQDKLASADLLPLGIPCKKVIFNEEDSTIIVELPDDTELNDIPEVVTLIAKPTIFNTLAIEGRITDIAETYFVTGEIAPLVKQILASGDPQFTQDNCLPVFRKPNDESDAFVQSIIHAVEHLDNSVLSIQGPPGTGKTYTANKVISELIKKGKRVGIMSNSHAAIFNLQKKVIESNPEKIHAKIGGFGNTLGQFKERHPDLAELDNFIYRKDTKFTKKQPYHLCSTIGATVYTFVKDDCVNSPVDYLFVDEASQVALANLLAVTPVTSNIVLMGDQMQLEQPIQGSHPGVAKKSALEHLLQDHQVIPDNKGVFLDKTYRMHPKVCKPISDLVYESKLTSAETTVQQKVIYKNNNLELAENGLQFVAVEHQNNTQESVEELEKIKLVLAQLENSELIDEQGERRAFAKKDILIVAPYNMQVNMLKENLSSDYRIGTIDKFQGQEGQVVIVSMASSAAEESARGVDFLFDVNRLNVAVSRAKALALIIASPDLLDTKASNPEQMKKINAFLSLVC